MPADSTSPSDEGRLARAIQLSPALTLQLPSAERTCELIPLRAVPLNSTIRVYRRVRDPQNQDSIISVRYQVTSNIQLGRRLLKLIDLDQTSIHTPVQGMSSADNLVSLDANNTMLIPPSDAANAIPPTVHIQKTPRDSQPTSGREVRARRLRLVNESYPRMHTLHVISQDAVAAGSQSLHDVANSIILTTKIYAQLTLDEVARLLHDGLASIDLTRWLPMDAHGEQAENSRRAYEFMNPMLGTAAPEVMRSCFTATFMHIEATMHHIFTYYVNLLKLHVGIKKESGNIIYRMKQFVQALGL